MTSRTLRRVLLLAVVSSLLSSLSSHPLQAQTVITVPGNAATIQAALDLATSGDSIDVAPGTYFEHDLDFHGKAVTLRGVAGAAATVIDGQDLGTVIILDSGEGSDTVLEGLTIFNGRAPNGTGRSGGGVRILGASPTIRRCVFAENRAGNGTGSQTGGQGGGVFVNGDGSPTFTDCVFRDNIGGIGSAVSGSAGSGGDGGALSIAPGNSSVVLTRCRFVGNRAGTGSDGTPVDPERGGFGGAVACSGGTLEVSNCIFDSNEAGRGGDWNDAGNGGGLAVRNAAVVDVLHCTFHDNRRGNANGGFSASNGDFGAIWASAASTVSVRNTIVWDNPGASEISSTVASVTFSDIQGGFAGLGNIDADPLFLDAVNGDFRIGSTSPCREVGDNTNIATFDIDFVGRLCHAVTDMGAHEYCVYVGTGEDLTLDVTVDVPEDGFGSGDLMHVSLATPGGTFVGDAALIAVQQFTAGSAPQGALSGLHVDVNATPGVVILYGSAGLFDAPVLGASPTDLFFIIPVGISGDYMIQGFALTFGPPAANGFFATTDGKHVTF